MNTRDNETIGRIILNIFGMTAAVLIGIPVGLHIFSWIGV